MREFMPSQTPAAVPVRSIRSALPVLLLAILVPLRGAAQQPCSLEECIGRALEFNPAVGRADRQYSGSVIQRREAGAALLPSVSLTGAFSRYTSVSPQRLLNPATNQIVEGSATALTSMSYYSGLSVSQRLFDRSVTARYTQALATEENSRAAALLEQQQVVLLTYQAYYGLLRSERNLEVAQTDLAYNQELLSQVKTLLELGRVARVDVLRQESAVAAAEQRFITARNGMEKARAELNYVMGRSPMEPLQIVDDLEEVETAVSLEAVFDEAQRSHPGIRQAALGVVAAQAGLEAARAAHWPTMNASGNYSWRGTSYEDIQDAFSRNYTWSVGVSIYLPMFDGLRSKYGIDRALVDVDGARQDREATARQVSREVHRAVLDLREADQVLASARRSIELAREAVRLAEERYELGTGTLLEVNASQLDRVNAQYGSVQALFNLKIARAALDFAMGRLER